MYNAHNLKFNSLHLIVYMYRTLIRYAYKNLDTINISWKMLTLPTFG